jgi:hypothetical protein
MARKQWFSVGELLVEDSLLMSRDTGPTPSLRFGNWVASGASGKALQFTIARNYYSDGQLDILSVFGESTTNLTSAYSAKCGRFRHIATGSSLTVAQETYGAVGQMCAKGVTLTHLHAGLMGTFEGTGAAVVLNSAYATGGHACVTARVGGHANITATTPLAGFLAFNNGSAAIASGTLSAFATSVASKTYPWGYGVYIPSGTAVAGIVMGEKSSSAAVGHPIGVQNSADTAGDKAIAVFCDDKNAVLASDAQGINSRCLILHAQTGAYGMSSLRGHLRVVASVTPSASKGFYGTESYLEASGTYTIGDGTNLVIMGAAAASLELGGTPTLAANSVACGVHVSGRTLPASSTGVTVGIFFQAITQGYQYAFGFSGVGSTDGNGLTTGSDSSNVTHKVACYVAGVGTRYLHLFSD